ncbi:MAG: hypothetical protein V2A64_06655 [Candidatus Omnitrophota bacterium]
MVKKDFTGQNQKLFYNINFMAAVIGNRTIAFWLVAATKKEKNLTDRD